MNIDPDPDLDFANFKTKINVWSTYFNNSGINLTTPGLPRVTSHPHPSAHTVRHCIPWRHAVTYYTHLSFPLRTTFHSVKPATVIIIPSLWSAVFVFRLICRGPARKSPRIIGQKTNLPRTWQTIPTLSPAHKDPILPVDSTGNISIALESWIFSKQKIFF